MPTPIFIRQPALTSQTRFFGRSAESIDLPDLIEIQQQSYQWFFDAGIKELFEELSPIKDFTGRDLELWLDEYYFDDPKFDEVTSRAKKPACLTKEPAILKVRKFIWGICR